MQAHEDLNNLGFWILRNCPDLSPDQKTEAIQMILKTCSEVEGVEVPARGAITATANFFEVNKGTISRLWKAASENKINFGIFKRDSMRVNCGRPEQFDREELQAAVSTLPRNHHRSKLSVATWAVSWNNSQIGP